MNAWLLYMLLAATVGGSIISLMGWAKKDPPEKFDVRSFVISIGDALIAGAIYSITLAQPSGDLMKDIITAAIFGAGGDQALRGVAGIIAKGTK